MESSEKELDVMDLLKKTQKAMEPKKEDIPEQKRTKRPTTPRVRTKPAKLVVPDHIKTLFNNLDKSINSVWGVQKNGKIKWDAKFSMWVVFKEYFEELM